MELKDIKQSFFVYRNGMLADSLRNLGYPYTMIFGLNVPQIAEIARNINPPAPELAEKLWAERHVRESRLLACYLFSHDLNFDKAYALIEDVQTIEEADMLCFRLLKHLDFAGELIERASGSDNELIRYTAKALKNHLS